MENNMNQKLSKKIENPKYVPKLIVSLTSYPKRIGTVYKTIQSLLRQTMKPHKIILWLAKEQFSEEGSLPLNLINLTSNQFEIRFCDDLKSHKKYYYVFQEFQDDCIVTVDDDCIYPNNLIKLLYQSYLKFPKAVSAIRGRIIDWDEKGILKRYEEWIHADNEYVGVPAMDLLPIGCGGVLYPPHLINKEVFNKDYILKFCINTDDLWLKIMHAINNVPTVLASTYFNLDFIEGSQEEALWLSNCNGNNELVMDKLIKDYNNFRGDNILLKDVLMGNYGDSIRKLIEKNQQEKKEELHRLLLTNKVIIYGAGYYGKKTYHTIKEIMGISIMCFAVTSTQDNEKVIEGLPVYGIHELLEYAKSCIVVVAVDQKLHCEITITLNQNGFNQYLLITESILRLLK